MAPLEVANALQSAAVAIDRAHGSSEDTHAVSTLPITIKNTFFHVEEPETEQVEPKCLSCPTEVFFPSLPSNFRSSCSSLSDALAGSSELTLGDLTAAARMFSTSSVTREIMEATGHVGARTLPPPPLSEPETPEDLDEPEAPVWTPKVDSPMHKRPSPPPLNYPETPLSNVLHQPFQMPFWTPKVGGLGSSAASSPVIPPFSPALPGGFMYTLQSQRSTTMYRVSNSAGVEIRTGPSFEAPMTDAALYCNEIFAVSEEVIASDGRIYLLLADGRGWVFDDSCLNSKSPSVVRGQWIPVTPAAMTSMVSPASTLWEPMEEPMTDVAKKRRRRKRGGVKRNKNKKSKAGFSSGSSADVDTDLPPSDGVEEEEDSPL